MKPTLMTSDSSIVRRRRGARVLRLATSLAAALLAAPSSGCLWEPPATITRADLGASYLELEQALAASPLAEDRVVSVNRRFDQATIGFFTGNLRMAIELIDRLAGEIRGTDRRGVKLLADGLKLSIEPAVFVPGSGATPIVAVQSQYLTDVNDAAVPLKLELLDAAGQARVQQEFAATGAPLVDERVTLNLPADLAPGAYSLQVATADGCVFARRTWLVAPRSLDDRRAENEARLAGLRVEGDALQRAIETCRARNSLLSDNPSEDNTAQWFYDLTALADEVAAEIAALAEARNPYQHRAGDTWRVVRFNDADVPFRVFAPASVAREPRRVLPLIIAFHGAGGDENLFFRGYGLGKLRTLAAERGVIVATPLTTAFLRDIGPLELLLALLQRDYAIDPDRIYVLGHSLGTIPTAAAATRFADRIAAAACLAGAGALNGGDALAPTLVYVAENDGISPPWRARAAADLARDAGREVEFRTLARYGHTLMAGEVLPEVLDWLLVKTRVTPSATAQRAANAADAARMEAASPAGDRPKDGPLREAGAAAERSQP